MRLYAPITKEPTDISGTALIITENDEAPAGHSTDIDKIISAILGRLEQLHAGIDLTLDLDGKNPGFPIDSIVLLSLVDQLSAGFATNIVSGVSRLKVSTKLDSASLTISFQAIHGEIKLDHPEVLNELIESVGGKFTLDKTLAGIDLFCFSFTDQNTRTTSSDRTTNQLLENDSAENDIHAGLTEGTILLTEDDRALRGLTELVLTRAGYRVLSAETAHHALELYRVNHLIIDLVITDLNLAGESGLDLARQLWEKNTELRIIFTSGDPHGARKIQSLGNQHLAYLEKPYRMKELVPFIQSIPV